jgi:hypothetical protein
MKKDIIELKDKTITSLPKEYKTMVTHINKNKGALQHSANNFYKGDSQYKMVTLNMPTLTPIRSIYHILAEVEQVRSTIESTLIDLKIQNIKLDDKKEKLKNNKDISDNEAEIEKLEILKEELGLDKSKRYLQGAIRKLSFLTTQHQEVLKKMGKDKITEKDYELDEQRHHVMTAFKQALIAARSRDGWIDEGNMIYFFDLGINGYMAQKEIHNILLKEQELLKQGQEPNHELVLKWLEECANKYLNCALEFSKKRGFKVYDELSTVKQNGEKNN